MDIRNHIDKEFDIGIVGGGASGIVASIFAKNQNMKVGVFEKEERVLKKVLRTGNGKCNLTNRNECLENYYGDPFFIKTILSKFPRRKTLEFFSSIGIKIFEDEDGRIYPYSKQASSVVDSLRFTATEKGVEFFTENRIENIKIKDDGFLIESDNRNRFFCKKLIVSIGGLAGIKEREEKFFQFLRNLEIKINKPFPSLVQLKIYPEYPFKSMEGCRWEAGIILNVDGENVLWEKNDIIFTDYGISGNGILNISREAVKNLIHGKKVKIFLDLLPDMTDTEIEEELNFRIKNIPERELEQLFSGWINKRIGIIFLKTLGYNLKSKIKDLENDDVKRISKNIHRFVFEIKDHNGFINSQVMAGGVETSELTYDLEHKRIKNLYFSGEIIDVDGKSGGFNLQWAWSSGFVAGSSCSKN
ncbi:MAG: aminoacetone oxidase family FAD-binding enzyme [candidate division WOR-3 bacterium]